MDEWQEDTVMKKGEKEREIVVWDEENVYL